MTYFLLHWVKLDIEEVWSVVAQSAILGVKYLPIPIFPIHHLILFSSHINTLACTLDERNIPLFFPNTENMSTIYRYLLFLTNQFLPSILSMYYPSAGYWVGTFIFFPSYSFLHPILVCNRLHNLLPLMLAQNPLRKMPLIATLPLVPFQFILLPSSLFCKSKLTFHLLNHCGVPLPSPIISLCL